MLGEESIRSLRKRGCTADSIIKGETLKTHRNQFRFQKRKSGKKGTQSLPGGRLKRQKKVLVVGGEDGKSVVERGLKGSRLGQQWT